MSEYTKITDASDSVLYVKLPEVIGVHGYQSEVMLYLTNGSHLLMCSGIANGALVAERLIEIIDLNETVTQITITELEK